MSVRRSVVAGIATAGTMLVVGAGALMVGFIPGPGTAEAAAAVEVTPVTGLYLKATGFEGESLDAGHASEVNLESMSFSGARKVTPGPLTGGTLGPFLLDEVQVTKAADSMTSTAFNSLSSGVRIPAVTLTQVRNGRMMSRYTFTNALVTEDAVTAGDDGTAVETLTFRFAKVKLESFAYNASGTLRATKVFTWNVETGRAT